MTSTTCDHFDRKKHLTKQKKTTHFFVLFKISIKLLSRECHTKSIMIPCDSHAKQTHTAIPYQTKKNVYLFEFQFENVLESLCIINFFKISIQLKFELRKKKIMKYSIHETHSIKCLLLSHERLCTYDWGTKYQELTFLSPRIGAYMLLFCQPIPCDQMKT